eukprot:6538224-Pyramimonas_sp.AAC.1
MEGKFDLTSIIKFDIMEEFESSEYDVTEGYRKEYQTRLEKLQTAHLHGCGGQGSSSGSQIAAAAQAAQRRRWRRTSCSGR